MIKYSIEDTNEQEKKDGWKWLRLEMKRSQIMRK